MDNIINDIEFIPQGQFGEFDRYEVKFKIESKEEKRVIDKKEFEFIQYHLKKILS